MLIVDAQVHLWNAGNPSSPWHRQVPAYLKNDALKEMDAAGVDAAKKRHDILFRIRKLSALTQSAYFQI